MNSNESRPLRIVGPNHKCPVCESPNVETSVQRDSFQYGEDDNSVELSAEIPYRQCLDCEFRYTDEAAEAARHAAVCRHHGLMNPGQIRDLRRQLGLSRAALARLAGVGEASLARWERGEVLQNQANDRLLFLMSFAENRQRLAEQGQAEAAAVLAGGTFRSLRVDSAVRAEQAAFSLRVAG